MNFVFNTIPCLIIDKKELLLINKKTLIIDLASNPGGIDQNVAKELNLKFILIITNLKEEYIMEDSPNEVQNIPSPTKIEEVDEPKTVEELQKELELFLKSKNLDSKYKIVIEEVK